MEKFAHLTVPEMGHGLIALAVLAAALPVLISAAIFIVLLWTMLRRSVQRMWRRYAAREPTHAAARLGQLASGRAG